MDQITGSVIRDINFDAITVLYSNLCSNQPTYICICKIICLDDFFKYDVYFYVGKIWLAFSQYVFEVTEKAFWILYCLLKQVKYILTHVQYA